jgi:uncharacterized membrane protein YkoI
LFKRIKTLLLTVMLLSLAQISQAQLAPAVQPGQLDINNSNSSRDGRQAQVPAPRISERQAIDLARQQFVGNVLRISLVGQGDSLRYQIRMENEGKIFTVFVDANTGAVSGG